MEVYKVANLDREPSIRGTESNVACSGQVHSSTNTGSMDGCYHWLLALHGEGREGERDGERGGKGGRDGVRGREGGRRET